LPYNGRIPELFPSHKAKSLKAAYFAVVEQFSPITVAGAALDLPEEVCQLPDYLPKKIFCREHLMLKILNLITYYTTNNVKIPSPLGVNFYN
jgi:hypothetical protein